MRPLWELSILSVAGACLLAISGCSTPTTITTTTPPNQSGAASYLYLAQNSPSPYSAPSQILVYPTGVSGNPSPANIISIPNSITASHVAVDSSGNIYIVTPTDVREYAATATGAASPIRSIPNNSTTTLNVVADIAVDSSGNVYALNAGVGIDIFSSTANGSVAPTRIIPLGGATTLSTPQYIAVDSLGNIYVSNLNSSAQFTVVVFGPTANGNVAPNHILNQFADGLAVDGFNNLYVSGFNAGSEISARLQFLSSMPAKRRGWAASFLNLLRQLPGECFSLNDAYSFEEQLAKLYPANNNVRPKIRQQLQVLRDAGIIQFEARGLYRFSRRATVQ